MFVCSDLFAIVDRYKSDLDVDKTINHITYTLPLYYAKDRTNLMGVYTLATNVGGKSSGNLSFEFNENECKFSQDLRHAFTRVCQDFVEGSDAKISIGFVLASGESFTFDASFFNDWRITEWNDLMHVSYNTETGVYRSYIMFPLDYLISSKKQLPSNPKIRYEYLLEALAKSDIKNLFINDSSEKEDISITIPIHRPTADTMNDMINRKKVHQPNRQERKHKVENGLKVK